MIFSIIDALLTKKKKSNGSYEAKIETSKTRITWSLVTLFTLFYWILLAIGLFCSSLIFPFDRNALFNMTIFYFLIPSVYFCHTMAKVEKLMKIYFLSTERFMIIFFFNLRFFLSHLDNYLFWFWIIHQDYNFFFLIWQFLFTFILVCLKNLYQLNSEWKSQI